MAGFGRIFGLANASTNYKGILSISNVRNISGNVPFMTPGRSKQNLNEQLGLPQRPKRAMTPFFKYLMTERPKFMVQHPELKYSAVLKTIAKQWATVDPKEKSILREQYEQEMLTYNKMLKEYEQTITSEQRKSLKEARDMKRSRRRRLDLKKKLVEFGKPKRPQTVFFMFLNERKHLKPEHQSRTDWARQMAQEWQEVTAEEKQKYKTRAQELMEQYKKDIKKWEEKMVREGHFDVVSSLRSLDLKSKSE
ncbi:transcription factor A, mitochondrial [Venturia canescens]|uniref:transcription factor A, mitochondrial n=1 Tax=Venturia canescens TaxID=32260 RepID=UPI001C9C3381|nr:transcription factor A, mitochondrial [Venturia canescens]